MAETRTFLPFWVYYDLMRHAQLLAQSTGVPNNGASNAEDFQPPTRNPQNQPTNTQQQTGGVQDTSGDQILSNPNLRIQVPQDPADPLPSAPAPSGGINWLLVIAVTLVLVGAVELLIRKREKRPKAIAPIKDEPGEMVTPQDAEAVAAVTTEVPAPTKKRFAKKKSKSKKKKK